MKLIKQIRLFFQEGNSDKVYEIDLCQVGDGYVVNFRYGRRGASLKEGTKTIFPVDLAEAEKVFSALEQEKRKKGYVAAGEAPVITSNEPQPKAGSDKRKKAILRMLKAAAEGEEPENWPLSRIIWRAGDLKMQEAIPSIIKLKSIDETYAAYSSVYAIGKCGSEKAVPFLKEVRDKKELPSFVRSLATEVLLKYSEGKDKEALLASIVESLPEPFRNNLSNKEYKKVERQIRELLFEFKSASNEFLTGMYQLSRESQELHERFLKIVDELPLSFNYFKHLRHIFKVAEMLEDYRIYGVIAKNIEKQNPEYKTSRWMNQEQKKQMAFSDKTKGYLTKRVVRFLKKYGDAGEPSYMEMATGILLAFDDSRDLSPAYFTTERNYSYDSQTRNYTVQENVTHFDTYSSFQIFNFILYKNSSRYVAGKTKWKCIPPYVPGNPAPAEREEAYPHLWNRAPEEIIELLSFSKSFKVQEFALKVFKANPEFEKQIEANDIIHILRSSFSITQQLGLDLARKKYDRNNPDKSILIALLDSTLEEARKQAEQWINEQKTTLLSDTEFVTSLIKMNKPDAHTWLRGFLSTVSFSREQSEIIITKIIAFIISSEISNEEDQKYTEQLGDTLIAGFAENIKYISLDIIKDLFRHSSPVIHTLAGKILIRHDVRPENLPEDFLQILLQSENANNRGIGLTLLGKFPENLLMEKKDVLISFCLSPMPDVRNAVKPIIFKLAKSYTSFGRDLVDLFVPAFLMKESYEGLHEDLLQLLTQELSDSLSIIPKEKTLVLLNSRFKVAQQLGAALLKKNIREEELTIPELVKLGNNPILEVRIFTWNVFQKYSDKIKNEKEEALRITDSVWGDTRIFSFDYFRKHFAPKDWSTDLLVSLCDSTKEDVQDFGREMITKCFEEDQGTEYLLKLSQHPNTKVQLFTTAYLEKYAGGNIPVIAQLKPFFITLLSQVNKGKAAKARMMDFLKKESLKNEEAAQIATEIFTRISVSVAITEKAECISALRDIRKKYPSVSVPLHVKEYGDYIKG